MKHGSVWFKIFPVPLGQSLKLKTADDPGEKTITEDDFKFKQIDVSIVAPNAMHAPLQKSLVENLDVLFPDVDVKFVLVEDSGHDARIYTLLVARSNTLRWGRDCLYAGKKKAMKNPSAVSTEISRNVSKQLFAEVRIRGVVDEYLQDQLVVFEALAEGQTGFPRGAEPSVVKEKSDEEDIEGLDVAMRKPQIRMRKDKTDGPFGEGSTHTTTARWVASELLPNVKWFNEGSVCEGIGVTFIQEAA